MNKRTRRQFSAEFKLEAVRLITEGGQPVAHVARELGIRPEMLRGWRRQVESRAGLGVAEIFPGHGQLGGADAEMRRLRRELEVARQEVAFLKKAATYFAKESR